jgi:hypothetical protein
VAKLILGILLSLSFCFLDKVHADEFQHYLLNDSQKTLLAQNDGDDTYDPFADYSEFEGNSDEEADINFFRNGRFFTLAFTFGYRRFTDSLATLYQPGTFFGGYLTYFFDLRFALQVGFVTGSHPLSLDYQGGNIRGSATISTTSFHLKYFFNTQNVTKGLANLNPYFIGGFSQVYRTIRLTGNDRYGRDSALSFDGGAGIEIPLLNNKMFLGLQGIYQFVNFPDENVEYTWLDDSDTRHGTGFYPKGDMFNVALLLGVNF